MYTTGMQELKELNSHCNLSDPCMAMSQPFICTGIYTTAIIDYLHKQLPSKAGHISSHVMLITHVTSSHACDVNHLNNTYGHVEWTG